MKNKFLSSILVLVLLIGAVLPAYAAVSIATDYKEKSELAAFYGEDAKILICTAEGFKYVSLAELEDGSEPSSKTHCKLCLTSSTHDKLDAQRVAYLEMVQQQVALEKLAISDHEVASTHDEGHSHSRAPPYNS